MLEVVRLALAPMLRAWRIGAEAQAQSLPRPTDSPQANAIGIDSDRVLLFGSGPPVGWGVLSHELALPGALARALSNRTGRGADVEAIADPSLVVGSAWAALDGRKLWRYDAIVIFLGVNDSLELTKVSRWRHDLDRLLDRVRDAASQTTAIIVVGAQPIRSIDIFDSALGGIADHHSRALNAASQDVCRRHNRVTYVPMVAPTVRDHLRHRGRETYQEWADYLAGHLLAPLSAARDEQAAIGETVAQLAAAEGDRMRAVEGLGLDYGLSEERFDRVVRLARNMFGTTSAAFSVIEGDTQWYKSRAGLDVASTPRDGTLCDQTIRQRGAFVVGDTHDDPLFAHSAVVVGEPHVRFYAGFPIESPSGERIGALCVFDPKPRDASEVDLQLLRHLALLVQAELREERVDPVEPDQWGPASR